MSDKDNKWLDKAKSAYEQSTMFIDNNYRKRWEDGIRHFQSRHASGSKYYKAAYKYRSRMFRSKTRSVIRSNEAAAAAAFFANKDVISTEAQNYDDEYQRASAEVLQEILNYRLTNTIPWFMTCIGGYQDSMKVGVVCSYQSWDYREKVETTYSPAVDPETGIPVIDPDTGEPVMTEIKTNIPVSDKPLVILTPVENIRFHPAADWIDPVNSSPYLIRIIPMYILDIKARMEDGNIKTGQSKWKKLTDDEIKSATKLQNDLTKQTRREGKQDGTVEDNTPDLVDYDVAWVHENFLREDDQDYVYYTLGTEFMLSDPVPIEEIYFTGERPVVVGCCIIDSHNPMPDGTSRLGKNLQAELNENVNQRTDNVKLVMNKRWFVRRGSQVDVKSITRNVPGSVTMVNGKSGGRITDDVYGHEFNDVTQSSYAEQDRLGLDFDELVGMFSPSSIQANRKMNETVGGMSMLRGASSAISEYSLRTFAETWVEPVMRQLIKLEQKYETDEVILSLAANKAKLFQKYGISTVTDDLLNQNLTVDVNVGMSATDPAQKLQHLIFAINSILSILSQNPEGSPLNVTEVIKEVFSYVGYKSGARFLIQQLDNEDPEKMQMAQVIQQLQDMMQELQQQLDKKVIDRQTKLDVTSIKEQGQDRRKAADIAAEMKMKTMDLMNPVVGENR